VGRGRAAESHDVKTGAKLMTFRTGGIYIMVIFIFPPPRLSQPALYRRRSRRGRHHRRDGGEGC